MKETILMDTEHALVRRFEGPPGRLSILDSIYVEKGELDDWKLLHELHYKADNLGIGPRYWRCILVHPDGHQETIGVMVVTVPKTLDSGRNQVFKHLRPGNEGRDTRITNRKRMLWINQNMILSSRVVLDTMYRGGGIAYRFRNLAFRMTGFRYVESRSSMSRFNPFSAKSGSRFVKPKSSNAYEAGLAYFARHFKSIPYDYVAIMEELDSMDEPIREKAVKELREFYYKHSSMEKSGDNRMRGTSRVDAMPVGYLLKQTQQLVFGSSMYGVYPNPDHGRELPARIPLLAFDLQGVDEPLRLDLL